MSEPKRIIVDPNSTSHRDPGLSVVSFVRAGCIPAVGETVVAVQPDDEGMDPGFSPGAPATVERIDMKYRLMYLRVAWDQFDQ